MPKHLTPAILEFETDTGGAGSPLDSVGYGANNTQVRLKKRKLAISEGFGEGNTIRRQRAQRRIRNVCRVSVVVGKSGKRRRLK